MRTGEVALVLGTVLCMMTGGPVRSGDEMRAAIDLTRRSDEDLVNALAFEEGTHENALKESVSFHQFDRISGEILRRRSAAIVALLLQRINDDTVVTLGARREAWTGWYDTPVRVKYKVRFILARLLKPEDFKAVVGDPLQAWVDMDGALAQFNERQARIAEYLEPGRE